MSPDIVSVDIRNRHDSLLITRFEFLTHFECFWLERYLMPEGETPRIRRWRETNRCQADCLFCQRQAEIDAVTTLTVIEIAYVPTVPIGSLANDALPVQPSIRPRARHPQ